MVSLGLKRRVVEPPKVVSSPLPNGTKLSALLFPTEQSRQLSSSQRNKVETRVFSFAHYAAFFLEIE
jgi:hypothetical protein